MNSNDVLFWVGLAVSAIGLIAVVFIFQKRIPPKDRNRHPGDYESSKWFDGSSGPNP